VHDLVIRGVRVVDGNPGLWNEILTACDEARAFGAQVIPEVYVRGARTL
jgi:DNA-binding cell septation regulator SpoVG